MKNWNLDDEPISTRLRNNAELMAIQMNKTMMYHEGTQETALIMDVWVVDPIPNIDETKEEDRYVRYVTEKSVMEDFSVDLDQEGWLWYDELEER